MASSFTVILDEDIQIPYYYETIFLNISISTLLTIVFILFFTDRYAPHALMDVSIVIFVSVIVNKVVPEFFNIKN